MQQKDTSANNVQANAQQAIDKVQHEVNRSRQPWYRTFTRARFLIAFYLVEFLLFTGLAFFVHFHPILGVDVAISQEFQENQAPWLHTFMIDISYLGNNFLVFSALILATALAFWLLRLRLEALCIIGLSVISSILNGILKYIVSRPRPTSNLVDIIQHATGQSFPSGHVMSYVAYWGLLFSFGLILFKRTRLWEYGFLIVPAFFVVLVGPSRIYLGDHWASDVLGGYLFGGLLLGLTLSLYLALKSRGVLSPHVTRPDERHSEPPTTHKTATQQTAPRSL